MKKYEWLLFDLDNTLTDFDAASHQAFIDLCEMRLARTFSEELYRSYKKYNRAAWEAFENNEIDTSTLRYIRFQGFCQANNIEEDYMALNAFYLDRLNHNAILKKDTKELLNALLKTHRLAIITNGLKENQRRCLDKLDLTRYFEVIVVSDEIGFSKPDISFFYYTMSQIGQPHKDKVLVIGDSLKSDIRGALNFGVDSIWFNEKNLENNSDIIPTYECSSILDILSIV